MAARTNNVSTFCDHEIAFHNFLTDLQDEVSNFLDEVSSPIPPIAVANYLIREFLTQKQDYSFHYTPFNNWDVKCSCKRFDLHFMTDAFMHPHEEEENGEFFHVSFLSKACSECCKDFWESYTRDGLVEIFCWFC